MRGPLMLIVFMVAVGAGVYVAKHRHPPAPVKVSVATQAEPGDRAVHASAQYWPSSFAMH
jgi:hypothetical protein